MSHLRLPSQNDFQRDVYRPSNTRNGTNHPYQDEYYPLNQDEDATVKFSNLYRVLSI